MIERYWFHRSLPSELDGWNSASRFGSLPRSASRAAAASRPFISFGMSRTLPSSKYKRAFSVICGLKWGPKMARAAASDVGTAVVLLRAGFEGARLNVRINLDQLADRAYADRVTAELERLGQDAASAIAALERTP